MSGDIIGGARKAWIINPIWEATVEDGGYWGIKFSSNFC